MAPSAPNRADVALFAGFVRRRLSVALPTAIQRWLDEQGWSAGPYARPAGDIAGLLNVPVPIDAWDLFDALFAWEQRTDDPASGLGSTYLGAAVRSFFAQGGRRCYVVRAGDPLSPSEQRVTRVNAIANLIPGYPHQFAASPADPSSWEGAAHLFGLPDVSFLCLPDLADLVASLPQAVEITAPATLGGVEQWVECSSMQPSPSLVDGLASVWSAPRCADSDYADWATAVSLMARVLNTSVREVQLVASVPMAYPDSNAGRDLLAFLLDSGAGPLSRRAIEQPDGLSSAFIQLVYPWMKTAGSADLPEQLESPDGVLVGVLARNALLQGAFHSAAREPLADVYGVQPELARDQLLRPHPDSSDERAASHSLLERVSLVGPTPDGWALLSDVTTSRDEGYRPASVNRLLASVLRGARRFGEESVFEASGPALWDRLRERVDGLLLGLFEDGALDGATANQAYEVRCDRSTMTQNDIDNGRVVAEVMLQAAMPIQGIRLVMSLDAAGSLSLAPAPTRVGVAA